MIIIFEGPDGSGKSTLYKAFSKATNHTAICIDRLFVSNIIYGWIYKRPDKYGEEYFKEMKRFNKLFKPLYVFVDADESTMFESIVDKGEEANAQDILRDRKYFNAFYEEFPYPNKIKINRTGKSIESCVKKIIKTWKKQRRLS